MVHGTLQVLCKGLCNIIADSKERREELPKRMLAKRSVWPRCERAAWGWKISVNNMQECTLTLPIADELTSVRQEHPQTLQEEWEKAEPTVAGVYDQVWKHPLGAQLKVKYKITSLLSHSLGPKDAFVRGFVIWARNGLFIEISVPELLWNGRFSTLIPILLLGTGLSCHSISSPDTG